MFQQLSLFFNHLEVKCFKNCHLSLLPESKMFQKLSLKVYYLKVKCFKKLSLCFTTQKKNVSKLVTLFSILFSRYEDCREESFQWGWGDSRSEWHIHSRQHRDQLQESQQWTGNHLHLGAPAGTCGSSGINVIQWLFPHLRGFLGECLILHSLPALFLFPPFFFFFWSRD